MSEITPEIRRLQAHAFGIARDVAAAFETKHNDGSSSAATFRALADHLLTEPEVVRAVTAWAKAIEREVERGGGATRSEAQDGERTHAKRLLDRHCSLELRCTLSAHQQEWWALNREREASEVEILQVLATGLQARRVESDRKPAAGMNLSQEKRRSTGLGPVVIAETAKWAGATWDTDGRWGFSMEAWQKFTTSLSADQPMEILTSPGVSAPESVAHPSHQTVREWMPVSEALRLSDLWTAGDLDNCGQWRAAIKVLADEVRALAASPQPAEPSAQGEPVAWISPKDRVPKGGEVVLCLFRDKGIHTALFRGTSTTHGVFEAWHGFLVADLPTDRVIGWVPLASAPSTPPHAVVEAGALTDERIDSLRGLDTAGRVRFYEHDFYVLSNFSAFTLVWKGIRFDTSEAAYHWEKFDGCDQEVQDMILEAPSAHAAFKIAESQRIVRRADWDEIKVDVMHRILRSKAEQHEYVRRKLLATGDRELVEDSWRDDFWGWGPNRDGKNMLGRLWMQVRSELRGIAPKAAQEKT